MYNDYDKFKDCKMLIKRKINSEIELCYELHDTLEW